LANRARQSALAVIGELTLLGVQEIAQAEVRARDLGITGVPFFIFDGRVGLSGAHPTETIRDAIKQARERSPQP